MMQEMKLKMEKDKHLGKIGVPRTPEELKKALDIARIDPDLKLMRYDLQMALIKSYTKKQIEPLIELLKIAKCPDCDGSGVISGYNHILNEPEQEQCRWCFERNQWIEN